MSFPATETQSPSLEQIVGAEARRGLTASPRTLPAWLFYDERGSQLFEQITALPEYYLTRTERALFREHAAEIVEAAAHDAPLTVVELGAGTASKSGLLLDAVTQRQETVLYQPIDVSDSALAEAEESLGRTVRGLRFEAQVADYTAGPIRLTRPAGSRVLALYIGSSIGNFHPAAAIEVLANLRASLAPGDSLLLGTDLAPGSGKLLAEVLAAYDDAAGVTAEFNLNVLRRLNRDLGTDFDLTGFGHVARWNPAHSRIEMHLDSLRGQVVHLPAGLSGEALTLHFAEGETIHTENSYKFTPASIAAMLRPSGFAAARVWSDAKQRFAVTLATAV